MFRLALALGGRTVAELERAISAAEVDEWMQYCALEPFGEWAAWQRIAMLCAVIANVNRNPKKQKPYTSADFMPAPPKSRKRNGPRDPLVEAELVKAAFENVFGDRIKRKPRDGGASKV